MKRPSSSHWLSLSVLLVLFLASISTAACAVGPADRVPPPQFSHETGAYDEAFLLTVTSDADTTVRYTLDGSMPTADSPVFPPDGMVIANRSGEPNQLASVSTNQITLETDHTPPTVSKGTVIRAAAFSADGSGMSSVLTRTYLTGLHYRDVKVISLVLDSSDLFDYDTGIYVMGKAYDEWMASDPAAKNAGSWEIKGNFSQKGREWERPVLVQIIEKDGSFAFEQAMGIRIMGTATRTYYQKSFRLYAREEYGSKRFAYPIISGLKTDTGSAPLEEFKTFVLRNGGNDNYFTLLRDPYVQALVPQRSFATQGAEPCIVFINGEYWGVYSITEDYSDHYIEYNYGVDNKNVIIVKNNAVDEGEEEDYELYKELDSSFYWRDFTLPEHYDWFCRHVDLQGCIDFMAVQLYTDNGDGIFFGNNWRIWRARETSPHLPYADGRWRFMLYDNDFALAFRPDEGGAEKNTLAQVQKVDWGWGLLFNRLMKNDAFRAQFINTFMDLRNTCFRPASALETLDVMQQSIAPYMPEQYRRNGPAWVIRWENMNTRFESELNVIRQFISNRYVYAESMLREGYGLSGAQTLFLQTNNAAGGTVVLNTVIPDLNSGSWEGRYFPEFPISLTAVPANGYVFTGWSGDVESLQPELSVCLTEDMAITANFERE